MLNAVMELEFDPAEWQRMGSRERMQRCIAFAENAIQLSARAAPELKQGYLELSRHWLVLAEEIEKHAR